MRCSVRTRAFALAVSAAALLTVPALPASAALTSTVTCTKVSSPPLKGGAASSTFTGCTPASLTLGGKGGTQKTPPPGSQSGSVGFKVTWNGGKGTTTAAITFAVQKTLGKCPATGGFKRLAVKGTVKLATGAAKTITKIGEPVTASQCVVVSGAKAGQSMLEPGTKFKL